jgi:hypothetical protein
VAVAVLGALTVVGRASAGQQSDASVVGTVTDESQSVLPGVTVTATSPALQGSRTAVTDAQGQYRISQLPIGTYTLVFELSGFRTLRREALRLTAGLTGRLDIALALGGLEETVTVSGASPVVDVASSAARTVLTRETLDLIPTARTGYNALMAQAPGVRETLQALGPTAAPGFRAFGQSNQGYQTFDGVQTTSPLLSQTGQYIDFAAFEEAVIATLGHDASVPTRGIFMNTVAKSGGNDFHGRGFFGWTNQTFQNSNITPELEAQGVGTGDELDLKDDMSGEFGGKIIRDKLWFFAMGRLQRERTLVQDCYLREAPFTGPSLLTSGEQCFNWERAGYITTKETYKINHSNTVNGMFMNIFRRDNEGASQFAAWERRRKQWNAWPSPTVKGEWQSVQGDARTMSLMYGLWVNRSGTWGDEFADGATPARDRITGYSWGTRPDMGERQHVFRENVRWGMDWYKSDLFKGNHSFKIGADYYRSEGNRARVNRLGPTYELVFANGVSDTIEVQNSPVEPTGRIIYIAPYIHDTWTVGRNLTLNVGVRYAYDNGKVPAVCREAANPPGDVAIPAQCFPDIQFPVFHSLAPRLRFAYDFTGDGRTLLKAGWGRYQKGRWFEEINTANRNVINTTVYTWRDLDGNKEYTPGEVNLDPNCVARPGVICDFQSTTFSGQGAALANGIVNPNERQAYTDEYMLQFEREVMPGFGLRFTGIYSKVLDWYRYENSLRPYESYTIPIANTDPGPDNIRGNADDPGTSITYWEYPVALRGTAFQAPYIVNDPAANKDYTSFELAASRRLANRWSMQASLSYTKIDDPLPPNTSGGTGAFEANTREPNAEINAADNTKEWQGRVSGSYLLPWDLQVSANYQARSGAYWARTAVFRGGVTIPSITLRVEPRDAHPHPTIHLTDFRLEKRLRFGGAKSLALRLNVFNLFNVSTVTARTVASGASFNRVTRILRGRLAEFNVAYDW